MCTRGILGVALGLFLLAGQAMAATISGDIYAPGVATVNAGSATVRSIAAPGGILQKRFRQLRNERVASVEQFGSSEAMASPYYRGNNSEFANRIWGSAIYTNIDVDSSHGQLGSGYDYKAWGGALGYDHAFGDFTLGAAFTYTRGDYDAKGIRDDITTDNYGVSVYATYYNCSGFFGDIFGGYNYGDNDMKVFSAGAWNSASPHTDSYWIGGTVGYDAKLTENFTLTPSLGLLWMHSESSSYGLGADRFGKVKQKSLLLPVEVAATYTHQIDDCSKVDFTVKGGYAYDFKNDGGKGVYSSGLGAVTPIRGVDPGRHNWNVGAGIKYSRDRFDIGAEYRFDGRKDYKGHSVSATIGINF